MAASAILLLDGDSDNCAAMANQKVNRLCDFGIDLYLKDTARIPRRC
jgi:hypothetical protein